MPLPHRTRHSATVTVLLTLVIAGCGSGNDPTTSGDSPSSSSSRTESSTGSTQTSSSGASTSTSNSPDPEVSVTAGKDPTQSTSDTRAGLAAADTPDAATSLSIPAVGLSTKIGPQGLRDGKVNPAPGEVIWFTGYDRVRPGATGTSVIAGHVISSGRPDSFAALEQLAKGDGVVLTYPSGAKLRFEVTSTDIVDKDELTTSKEIWGAKTDSRRVVLVTCDDKLGFREDGHRTANFVAVAELAS